MTKTTLNLRVEHDLVSLRRRTRSLCEQLGFDEREIRRVSAAAFEAARTLFAQSRVLTAELRRAATRIELGLSAPSESVPQATQVAELLRPLRSLVDLEVRQGEGSVTVDLRVPLPARQPPDAPPAAIATVPAATAPFDVHRALDELQLELQETNRGVIALHEELEVQGERLRQAEERFRVLLDSVHDYAIFMLDPDGEVVSWNAGAERLFGYQADEIIGRNVACVYAAAERDERLPEEHLGEARTQGRFECECLRVRRGGSAFDAHVVLSSVRGAGGALRGFSVVVRDITRFKRLEEDLRRRAEELAAANRAKEDFLATLSHELRTPLNAMLGWTRLLRMGKLDEQGMTRALETIERNAHIQEQLIADILDLSRIVTGKLRLSPRPVQLGPILQAAVDAVRPAAEAKGLVLGHDLAADAEVFGDPDRLQQVVWNLLANAIKFTPAGGRVAVSAACEGAAAVIRVADTGEGIAPELLPFVFDRFRQGDASATRRHGGLGLGLSIVRHIVELHGGHVQARSDGAGRGALFTIHLPLRVAAEAGAPPAADPPAGDDGSGLETPLQSLER